MPPAFVEAGRDPSAACVETAMGDIFSGQKRAAIAHRTAWPLMARTRSDWSGKDHLANVSDDPLSRLRLAERPIVDESLRQVRRSRPSRHALRPVFVGHVDVK